MITVTFADGCLLATASKSLWQYDYGQQLEIVGLDLPEVFQVDFCNSGDTSTITVLGENNVVSIPDQFILDGRGITAFCFVYDETTGGTTRAEMKLPVLPRPERTEEQPDPEQEHVIDQLISELGENVEDAEAWAVGERDGVPVSEGDPTYNNSAKYWAGKAMTDAPVTSVNGKTGDIVLDLDDIPNGETYARATPEQLAQIGENADDIADIDAMIPNTTSESNPLVNVSFLTNRLTSYRTSAAQDAIDSGKQEEITAFGILKRDRSGNITGAIAGTDYLTADALNGYRKASAQDAIDNAQNTEIGKNTAAINTMQPAATAADIGKALIVKTVADGKPTSYEYGKAGGDGGSALTAGDGIDITEDVISNTQGIEYIVGTQAASTASWKGNSTDETLKVGKIIAYYLPFAGSSSSNATLTLTMGNGAQTAAIPLRRAGTSTVTNQFAAGNVIILIYDGGFWRVSAYYDQNDNTVPTGYCLSPAATAAKAATCSYGYRGDTNYFPCLFRFANTATDATLAITTYAPEAAPIYVNGARTSASNTFSAGVILFLYYNGAYYCYNDGRFPILVDGTVTSVQEYAAGLLANYRTAAAQDVIDAGKQAKITANGILKGDGDGGVSSAVAGTDYITGLEILSYGNSTWADFLAAYTANKVVYCRASSNSNPASGSQTRMAFMAFVNDAANPTNVEFQYYRSVSSHSDSQQGDQVFIYKLDKTGGWTVTTRNTFTAIDAGTGLSKAYANGKLTLSVDGYRTAADQDVIDSAQDERIADVEQTTTATTIGPVALATFEASAADMPLKGLTVDIEPVQDLHGYDNPWPAGGGKNIFDEANADWVVGKVINSAGDIIDNSGYKYSNAYMPISGNTQYCFQYNKGSSVTSGMIVAFYDSNKNFISRPYAIDNTASTGLLYGYLTTPANAAYFRLNVSRTDSTEIQVAIGSTATAYEPYSNICPITGWTGCNLVRTGKNLIDVESFTLIKSSARTKSKVLPQKIPAGTYSLSFDVTQNTTTRQTAFVVRAETGGGAINMGGINVPAGATGKFSETFEATEPFVYIYVFINSNDTDDATITFTNIQLEQGDTVTAYEPYQGGIYNITFPTEAGTVYGATLDVVNGVLTLDRVGVKIKDINWTYASTSTYQRFQSVAPLPYAAKPASTQYTPPAGLMCECYQIHQANSLPDKNIAITNSGVMLLKDDNYTTQADLKAAVGEYLIVYTIATPIEYQLTAEQITTLLGTNNIWADCGDVTLTYGAYLETVKAYADQVGDSILSAIAPLEMNYTASRSYAAGSFLFVGTKFYKVTAAISSGDTITPDTNVTQTTVAEQLMALAANA